MQLLPLAAIICAILYGFGKLAGKTALLILGGVAAFFVVSVFLILGLAILAKGHKE